MDSNNILTEGIEALYTIKENLLELNGYKEKSQTLLLEDQKLDSEIAAKEKLMNDEINAVIKKRKDEISSSFDEQLDSTKARIKKVRSKKEKSKDVKVSERIKVETSEFEEEKVLYQEEIKKVFKVNKIPRIFNTQVYYVLFMPRSLKDVFFIFLTLLLVLLAAPIGAYYYLLPEPTLWLVIAYILTFLFFGGLYIFINNITKEKHREAFVTIKDLRVKIADAQKKINQKKKAIIKDKDESTYGLEKFNKELDELERETASIAEARMVALVSFESSTKYAIAEGIKTNYKDELNELHHKHDAVYEEQRKAESKAKEFAIEISQKYEGFVGKEILDISYVDELIRIMEADEGITIAEAVKMYKSGGLIVHSESKSIEQNQSI